MADEDYYPKKEHSTYKAEDKVYWTPIEVSNSWLGGIGVMTGYFSATIMDLTFIQGWLE